MSEKICPCEEQFHGLVASRSLWLPRSPQALAQRGKTNNSDADGFDMNYIFHLTFESGSDIKPALLICKYF